MRLFKIRAELRELRALSREDVEHLMAKDIFDILPTTRLKPGEGMLRFSRERFSVPVSKEYYVLVSAFDVGGVQELVFMHEVFHIPLLRRGINVRQGEWLFNYVENRIDEAVLRFHKRWPLVVTEHFSRLLRVP